MKLEVHEISPALSEDFCQLHSRLEFGGCFCRFWQFEGEYAVWEKTTPEENRKAKESEIVSGKTPGALFYLNGKPVGWCQFAHRSFFKKMNSRDGFKHSANEDVWAISCFAIAKEVRKTGLSHRILEKVLERIKSLGGKTVEAYPEKGDNLPDDDVWMGPKRIFEAAGFTPHSETPKILVMRKEL